MMAVAPYHWYVQPLLAFDISIGVGYCFIHTVSNARSLILELNSKFPHLFCFICVHLGIVRHNFQTIHG